jgi:hypothetical protein
MRVLACGAIGLVLREVMSGGVPKALTIVSSAKVCILAQPFHRGYGYSWYHLIRKVDHIGDDFRGLFSPAR